MSKQIKMLAFDFGASSGRAILGIYDGDSLGLEEIHRFSNDPVEIRGNLHWDTLRLLHEIKQGIIKCVNKGHKDISSVAIDTWGVDYGLIDENGDLLGNPYHYRDKLTDGIMEKVFNIIPGNELYNKTGIQFMKLNTIFQLYAMKHYNLPVYQEAKTLLLTPDLMNYFLTGEKKTEYSIASTTQLLDPYSKTWSKEIIDKLGLNKHIFTEVVHTGTIIGYISDEISEELGIGRIPVIATAAHDTQSAIASVPTDGKEFVYISCGTWSLMGLEMDKPIINDKSFEMSFTNEGGVGGKTTFHKNIMGLWLVQECKRQWDREGRNLSFADLEALAGKAQPFRSYIDPDHESFIAPGNMPERIREFCRKTGQKVPVEIGDIVICIAQSLAMKYRHTIEELEDIKGGKLPVVHMVGGGIKDRMLCRFTANATNRPVFAGPVEATSIGNLMIQAMALGEVKDLEELRKVVKASFPVTEYVPDSTDKWTEEYKNFKEILKN